MVNYISIDWELVCWLCFGYLFYELIIYVFELLCSLVYLNIFFIFNMILVIFFYWILFEIKIYGNKK